MTAQPLDEKLIFALGIDHRLDFCRELVGSGERPTAAEREQAASLKQVVFDGLVQAVEGGLPKSNALVWADHDLGEGALLRARAMSLPVAVSVEKPGTGLAGLSLESTADAWSALTRLDTPFAGVRTPYNFADETPVKQDVQEQLRALASKCKEAARKLVIELTPRPTAGQLAGAGGTLTPVLRAQLLLEAMRELQDSGVEPSVWVVAPPQEALAAATVSAQAHVDGRTGVTVLFEVGAEPDPGQITMGPSKADRAMARLAARTAGTGGMLVGPDAYFATLARLHQGLVTRPDAVSSIGSHLKKLWELFDEARRKSEVS